MRETFTDKLLTVILISYSKLTLAQPESTTRNFCKSSSYCKMQKSGILPSQGQWSIRAGSIQPGTRVSMRDRNRRYPTVPERETLRPE